MAGDTRSTEADRENKLVVELIDSGGDLAGAASGAAIGLLGGPIGAIGGAVAGVAVTRTFRRVGADIRQRFLGPREEVRIGAATAHAAATIHALLEAGHMPRDDGFFEAGTDQRPPSEELLEGVMLKARDAYEERKVRFLGMLYGQVAFHPDISVGHANHLLELASRLTYRQMVILAVVQDDTNRSRLRMDRYGTDNVAIDRLGLDGIAIITELYDLYQQGLVNGGGKAWISVGDVAPAQTRLQGSGAVLARLMAIDSIPFEEREPIYETLSG